MSQEQETDIRTPQCHSSQHHFEASPSKPQANSNRREFRKTAASLNGSRASILISSALKCLLIVGSSHDQVLALASFLILLLSINQAASVACQEMRTQSNSSTPTSMSELIAGANGSLSSSERPPSSSQAGSVSPRVDDTSNESCCTEPSSGFALVPVLAVGFPDATGAVLPDADGDASEALATKPRANSASSLDYYPKQQQVAALNSSSDHLRRVALNSHKQTRRHHHQHHQQQQHHLHRARLHRQLSQRPTNQQHYASSNNAPRYRQVHVPRPLMAAGWRQSRHQEQAMAPLAQHPVGVYKRVLLCDKTLVSLDYAKGANSNNNKHNHHHLDLKLAATSTTSSTATSQKNNQKQQLTSSNYHNTDLEPDSSSNAIDPDEPLEQLTSVELLRRVSNMTATARSSLLSDDDALIRCDMWDLEKGLKSRKPPLNVLRLAVKADFATVREAINRCRRLSESRLPADDGYRDELDILTADDMFSLFNIKRGLIPGTKWCGLGDIASSYNDLGTKHRIDICCRAHDHCPTRLKPFRNDYGVLNIALYTKSHCDCDADFYKCLRNLHSKTADMLGNLYFNVMKLQCLREEKLKVCRKMRPIALGLGRCVRYDVDHRRSMFKFTTPPVAY